MEKEKLIAINNILNLEKTKFTSEFYAKLFKAYFYDFYNCNGIYNNREYVPIEEMDNFISKILGRLEVKSINLIKKEMKKSGLTLKRKEFPECLNYFMKHFIVDKMEFEKEQAKNNNTSLKTFNYTYFERFLDKIVQEQYFFENTL